MGVDKRCAASGRALQVQYAAKRNTACENTFVENFAKLKQMHARKKVCGDEFATILLNYLQISLYRKGLELEKIW